ncbi:transglutaminase family protein [Neotamlana laminarinivorans]|uniref:Transglutaminase family protein n=1 Tax=Neotamlana laminarinivorans TaxID=2883124 RepID=A0A9X1HXQ7_9FLAO|nr:transglutaminase family protein [Tamlana laminarinivorans]MCB4797511.1 transglutaminase family protein [Tamlana laminarinivorans]
MTTYQLSHITSYNYEYGVTFCHNLATLKPKNFLGQTLLDYSLEISPTPAEISNKLDFFGNNITRFSIQKYHKELKVTATSKILRDYTAAPNIDDNIPAKGITLTDCLNYFKQTLPELISVKQFILESVLIAKITPAIKAYAEVSFKPNRSVFEATYELMHRIFTDFEFNTTATNVATPIQDVIKKKKGVCQDFAQIAIACVRSVGLPARYVSGYIETLPPPGKEKLIGSDASHAWFSVYIPNFGWVDFDPTNDQIPKNQHLVVAHGRDYYDVPPLKGVIYSTGQNKLHVSVDLRPAN